MRAARENGQLVAIVSPLGEVRRDYERIRLHANEVGLHEDAAFVVSLDRVVIEILLREYMQSSAARERIVPALLTQRAILSWWIPNACEADTRESCKHIEAHPEVMCVVVPCIVKAWVMEALTGWEI